MNEKLHKIWYFNQSVAANSIVLQNSDSAANYFNVIAWLCLKVLDLRLGNQYVLYQRQNVS